MKNKQGLRRRWCQLLLGGLLLVSLPLPALAIDWYTVEVLVFAELDDSGLDEETWSGDPGLPDLNGALEPGAGGSKFQWLADSNLKLSAVARQLDRSGRYRTLMLSGWRQPGYGPRRALPVHVRSDPSMALIAPAQVTGTGFVSVGNDRAGIEGIVRVHRSRFLHVLVDLLYSRPAGGSLNAVADAVASTPSLIRMTQTRRMRSNEMHYYDHPLFGVLVKITPYGTQKQAEPAADAQEEAGTEPAAAN